MAHYAWIIEALDGEPLGELSEATGRSLSFDLRGPATAQWNLDGRHEQANLVHELTRDLVVYRDRLPLFRGRIGGTDDDLDEDKHDMSCSAVDYRGMLARRIIDHEINFVDPWNLRDLANHILWWAQGRITLAAPPPFYRGQEPGDDLGIQPSIDTDPVETREGYIVTEDMDALKAIDDAAYGLPGFDWWIDTDKRMHVVATRGIERSDFPLVYGTTVTKVKRQVDTGEYANRIRFRGGKPDKPPDPNDDDPNDPVNQYTRDHSPDEEPWPPGNYLYEAYWVQRWEEPDPSKPDAEPKRTKKNERELWVWFGGTLVGWQQVDDMPEPWTDRFAPDLGERLEGRFDKVVSDSDLKLQTQVDAAADYELSRQGNIVPAYDMTLRPDLPFWAPENLWLGDTTEFHIQSGRLDIHDRDRVEKIDISISEEGEEEVTITLGRKRSDLLAWFNTVPRRIERLERR